MDKINVRKKKTFDNNRGSKEFDVYIDKILVGQFSRRREFVSSGKHRYRDKIGVVRSYFWNQEGLRELFRDDTILVGGSKPDFPSYETPHDDSLTELVKRAFDRFKDFRRGNI